MLLSDFLAENSPSLSNTLYLKKAGKTLPFGSGSVSQSEIFAFWQPSSEVTAWRSTMPFPIHSFTQPYKPKAQTHLDQIQERFCCCPCCAPTKEQQRDHYLGAWCFGESKCSLWRRENVGWDGKAVQALNSSLREGVINQSVWMQIFYSYISMQKCCHRNIALPFCPAEEKAPSSVVLKVGLRPP